MSISISMSCPACGGALSMDEGHRFSSCPYCSSVLSIEGEGGVEKITLSGNIDKDKSLLKAGQWLESIGMAMDLGKKASIKECYQIYVPFWKMKARASGWVCGYSDEDTDDGSTRVYRENIVMRDLDWNMIACDPGDLGIIHLKNIEGKAVLHDEGSIPTFEATVPEASAMERGIEEIRKIAIKWSGIDSVSFSKVHVFPKNLVMIFYPVWIIRYDYMGGSYFATIDGINGNVLSGRAPGETLIRGAVLAAGTAIGGFGLGFALWLAKVFDYGWLAALIALPVCVAVAAASYRYFSRSNEYTTGAVKTDAGFKDPLEKAVHGVSASDAKNELKVKI
jgi:hypothetical protein